MPHDSALGTDLFHAIKNHFKPENAAKTVMEYVLAHQETDPLLNPPSPNDNPWLCKYSQLKILYGIGNKIKLSLSDEKINLKFYS